LILLPRNFCTSSNISSTMYFSTLLVLVTSTLTLALPAPSGPNPDEVTIAGFTYAGTGCPAGSIASSASDDRTVLTLLYSDYVASIGPGTAPSDHRKNCQVVLDIHYPQGFQYSIFSADYRGYEDLESGVTGQQVATYYFSGQTQQATGSTTWTGPKTSDYLVNDELAVESIVWSPCGATLPININSQIRLTSSVPTASGLLTTDSTDFKFHQIFHLQWRKCE